MMVMRGQRIHVDVSMLHCMMTSRDRSERLRMYMEAQERESAVYIYKNQWREIIVRLAPLNAYLASTGIN